MKSVLALSFLLSACAPNIPSDVVPVGEACPDTKKYTKQKLQSVKREIERCGGKCKNIEDLLINYKVLRDKVKACGTR